MCDRMIFPATVDEFMEEYKVVDSEHIYSNGMEMIPIFRMKQWFEHEANHDAELGKMVDDTVSRQAAIDAISCDITVTGRQNAELVAATIGAFADRIKALPSVYVPDTNVGDMISRQAAIDAIHEDAEWLAAQGSDWQVARMERDKSILKSLPTVQPTNETLERCRFEYIHACKIVSIPTPDVTRKDIQDAYAVIKALQPIFGDVPFAKVKRGDSDADD